MRTPDAARPRPEHQGWLALLGVPFLGVAFLGVAACRRDAPLLGATACSDAPLRTARAAPDVLAALRADGEARVIVALVSPPSEADPSADPARRRAEIARLQREVLACLGPDDFRQGQLFGSVPAISGTVLSEAGLSILLSHPHVRRVDLDPAGGGSSAR